MFSHNDILRAIRQGELKVEPFDERLLQPASLDLRLGDEFLSFHLGDVGYIDPAVDQSAELYIRHKADGHFFIHPGQFIVATTVERLEFPLSIVGRLEGKSSLGRLGLLVHSTAGFMDPGFQGQVTLELANVSPAPVKLYVGMPIAQMSFDSLATKATEGYSGKYMGQLGPQPSSYHKNFAPGGYMASALDPYKRAGTGPHPHNAPETWRDDGKCIWKSCGVWKAGTAPQCNCASYGNASMCPIHTQADYDAQQ